MSSYSLAGSNLKSPVAIKVTKLKDYSPLFPQYPLKAVPICGKIKPSGMISSASCLHQSHDAWQIIFDWIMYSCTLNTVCRVLSQPCFYYLEAGLLSRKKKRKATSSSNQHSSYNAQKGRGCALPAKLIPSPLFLSNSTR